MRDFFKYTALNVIGMIGLSCYILADTFFISKSLGANGLTALNLAIPIYSFIHGTGLMLGMGGATRYSIFTSQKNPEKSNTVFTHTVFLSLLFSCVFFLCGIFFTEQITGLIGADQAVFRMTRTYLRVILLFSPLFIMNEVLLCYVRNDGSPRLSMAAMLTGSISNIILDYIFIFPMNMGIFGAVFATGLAPVISMMVLSRHFYKKANQFHLTKIRPKPADMLSILSVGFPSLITEVSSGIVIMVFNIILLNLSGNIGVAAYGVIANLSLVVTAVFTGVAQGVQPLLSQAYGSQDPGQIKKLTQYALCTVTVLSVLIYLVIYFNAAPIVHIFNSKGSQQMQLIAENGLKLYFISAFFISFNIIVSVYFTATDTPLPAHILSLLRGFILIIPMAFLLSALWNLIGVWLTFPLTEAITCVIAAVLMFRTKKKPSVSR